MVAVSEANPFPGLRPFDFADRNFFFGRELQIRELRRKLKSNRFIAVVGRSGCGKSSLVRAGLLKLLTEEGSWRWMTMRPQGDPLQQLALAVLGFRIHDNTIPLDIRLSRTETALRRSSSGLVDLLYEGTVGTAEHMLLVVDQFEELFRFGRERNLLAFTNEAQAFVTLLLRATHSTIRPIHVLLTMRSEFLGDCARFRGLPEAINDSQFLVPRLTRDQRRRAIEQPLEKAGAEIEPALLQRLLNEVGDDPDQLPVLQHVLMRTWQVACPEYATDPVGSDLAEAPARVEAAKPETTCMLRLSDYEDEAIGGMSNALSKHADSVLQNLLSKDQLAAERIFKALIDVDREGRAVRRTPPPRLTDLAAIVGDRPRTIRVVNAFRAADCGFLVPSVDDLPKLEDDRRIDVAHEALIRRWTKISGRHADDGWLAEEKQDGRIYQRLLNFIDEFGPRRALGADEAAKRVPWWSPDRRNAAWAERYGGRFDEVMRLIERSKGEVRRAALRKIGLYALILLPVVVIAAAYATLNWMQERELRQQIAQQTIQLELKQKELIGKNEELSEEITARVAAEVAEKKERSRVLAKQSIELTTVGDAATGLALALAATASTEDRLPTAEAEQAIYLALENLHQEIILSGHEDLVLAAGFSPDGGRIVSGSVDATVRIWDAVSGVPLVVLRGHEDWVRAAAFSQDGKRIVSGSDDGTVRVWDAASGAELMVLRGHEQTVSSAAFSPDGARIVSGSWDNTVRLWDAASGAELMVLRGHEEAVVAAAFSPDGARIVSGSSDSTVRLWDAASGAELLVLRGHQGPLSAAAFSPDGGRIVSASDDQTVRVWDAASGTELLVLRGHEGRVWAAAFSADRGRIVSGSADATVRVWDAASGTELLLLRGHEGEVNATAFSPDGGRIVSASDDTKVQVWRVDAPLEAITYRALGQRKDQSSGAKGDLLGRASDKAITRTLVALADKGVGVGRADIGTGATLWLDHTAPAAVSSISAQPLALHQSADRLFAVDSHAQLVVLSPEREIRIDLPGSVIKGAAFDDAAVLVLLTSRGELARFAIGETAIRLPNVSAAINLAPAGQVALDLGGDGKSVLAAAADGRVLRSAGSMVETLSVKGPEGHVLSVEASADLVATVQATRAGERVIVWQAGDGTVVADLSTPIEEGQILEAAISPSGDRVLTAASNGPLRLWALSDASAPIALFGKGVDRFTGAAFAADGRRIAAAQATGDMKVWPIFASREELIEFAKERAPRRLTFAQKCQYKLAEEAECQAAEIPQ